MKSTFHFIPAPSPHVSLSLYIYIYLPIYLYTYVYVYTESAFALTPAFSGRVSIYISPYLSLYISTYLSIYTCIYLYGVRFRFDSCLLSLSLYSIFVSIETFVHESTILLFPTPICVAHTIAMLLHDHCVIYNSPRPPFYVPHTIYNIGNSNIV